MCPPRGDETGGSLKACTLRIANKCHAHQINRFQITYKQYNEMTEALAERLLDLHVRLLSLYIIQDADCLHWEKEQPFFESERGSYTIQMWWLYIQGTKQDLWNSVPPSMAKRVLAEMLNETLTILTVRYEQIVPSMARSQLLLVDISNLLLCMADVLPSVCENGEALIGLNITQQTKSIRDIHAKCHELFFILLSRGIPLGTLYKVFHHFRMIVLVIFRIISYISDFAKGNIEYIQAQGCRFFAMDSICNANHFFARGFQPYSHKFERFHQKCCHCG